MAVFLVWGGSEQKNLMFYHQLMQAASCLCIFNSACLCLRSTGETINSLYCQPMLTLICKTARYFGAFVSKEQNKALLLTKSCSSTVMYLQRNNVQAGQLVLISNWGRFRRLHRPHVARGPQVEQP